MKCLNCDKETSNPKFCSRSCSASYSNKNSAPKRKRTKKCHTCHELILAAHKYCEKCRPKNISPDMTLLEASCVGKHLHRSSLFSKVRARARAATRDLPQVCERCGYDKHVEVAHIKGIAIFPDSTMVSEINSLNNLMLLCPNCHWEFDNHLWRSEQDSNLQPSA